MRRPPSARRRGICRTTVPHAGVRAATQGAGRVTPCRPGQPGGRIMITEAGPPAEPGKLAEGRGAAWTDERVRSDEGATQGARREGSAYSGPQRAASTDAVGMIRLIVA